MAVTPHNIWFGAARVYTGCDIPPSGNRPTFSAGVPSGGAFVGATSRAEFSARPSVEPLASIISNAAIDAVTREYRATISVDISEISSSGVSDAVHVATTDSLNRLFLGTIHHNIPAITGICIVQMHPSGDGSLLYAFLYRAVILGDVSIAVSRERETIQSIVFSGLEDTSRPSYDRQFQFGIVPPPSEPVGMYGGGTTYGWMIYG